MVYSNSDQVHFFSKHFFFIFGYKNPNNHRKKQCCNKHHQCLIVSPFCYLHHFFCYSNKCCHSNNLVVTHGCQYYCKNGKTRKPARPQRLVFFGMPIQPQSAAKNTRKQGHLQGHNNQHALANATKVDCCYCYFGCVNTAKQWPLLGHR